MKPPGKNPFKRFGVIFLVSLMIFGCKTKEEDISSVSSNCVRITDAAIAFDWDMDGSNDGSYNISINYQNNGTWDQRNFSTKGPLGTVVQLESETYSYDSEGNLTSSILLEDQNNDGTTDNKKINHFTTNTSGFIVSDILQQDQSADGDIDQTSYLFYQHDQKQKLQTSIEQRDEGGNGMINFEKTFLFERDSSERITTMKISEDNSNDGFIDEIRTTAYVYDSRGLLSSSIESRDVSGDGSVEDTNTTNYSNIIGLLGRLEQIVLTVDNTNDSNIDEKITIDLTWEAVATSYCVPLFDSKNLGHDFFTDYIFD